MYGLSKRSKHARISIEKFNDYSALTGETVDTKP